ncbi:MAG: mechanosensitive ion channel family protein [Clostridia bacterium]|nr:mechanosensitive ion channel family protein [Candidatus Limimonas egerieequi]MCQ2489356.1 mechanosensitive ion channel family protein [Clostridia bacterium]
MNDIAVEEVVETTSENIGFIDNMQQFWQDVVNYVSNNYIQMILGVIVIILFLLFRKWLSRNISNIFTKIFKNNLVIGAGIRTSVQGPLKSFFFIFGFYLGFLIMGFPAPVVDFINKIFRISNIVLITWALVNFTPFITSTVIKMEETNKRANAVAIKFIANVLKVIIISLAVVVIISELGYNITGLITGLGLGGLTFSLAAQSTASNLFAGFSIVADKPFDVGDYIVTPSLEGTVEDITMRSTRVRTVADTVVVIPNSKLVDEPITNATRMNKRYVDMTIGLTYDADAATLRNVIEDIKSMLEAHLEIQQDRILVAFKGFGDSSQDIRILYFTKTTALDPSLRVQEDINFKIKDIVEKNGASFAFPSVSIYEEKTDK